MYFNNSSNNNPLRPDGQQGTKFQHLIHRNVSASFASSPFHSNNPFIKRFVAENFPIHLTVHKITKAQGLPNKYVQPHYHKAPEINILMGGKKEIEYEIQLGYENYQVRSPASIWIPPRLPHAANVLTGSGYFVCIILSKNYRAFKWPHDSE